GRAAGAGPGASCNASSALSMSAAVGGSNSAEGTGTGRVPVARARLNGPDGVEEAGAAGWSEGGARAGVEVGEHARMPPHGHAPALGLTGRRQAGLLEPRLFSQDPLQRRLAVGRQLVEPDAHARRDVLARLIVLADPDHRPLARQERRAVLQLELQLQPGVDRQRLAGADEDPTPAHVGGVPLDELIEAGAAKLDAEVGRSARLFRGGLAHVLRGGGDETIGPFGLCKAVIIPDINRKSHAAITRSSLPLHVALRARACTCSGGPWRGLSRARRSRWRWRPPG